MTAYPYRGGLRKGGGRFTSYLSFSILIMLSVPYLYRVRVFNHLARSARKFEHMIRRQ